MTLTRIASAFALLALLAACQERGVVSQASTTTTTSSAAGPDVNPAQSTPPNVAPDRSSANTGPINNQPSLSAEGETADDGKRKANSRMDGLPDPTKVARDTVTSGDGSPAGSKEQVLGAREAPGKHESR